MILSVRNLLLGARKQPTEGHKVTPQPHPRAGTSPGGTSMMGEAHVLENGLKAPCCSRGLSRMSLS